MGFDLSSIFGGTAKGIVDGVTDLADKFIDTKAEKAERDIKLKELVNAQLNEAAKLAQQETEIYLKDIQSAREANTRIQESDKASWLAKNVAYLLDITFTTSFFVMLGMILFATVPEGNKELFYTGFGALTTYVATILGFHRGSSKGSEKGNDFIKKHIVGSQKDTK